MTSSPGSSQQCVHPHTLLSSCAQLMHSMKRRSKNSQSRSRSPPSATTDGNEAAAEESDASIQEEEDDRRARKLRRSATTPSTSTTAHNVSRSKSANDGASRRARFAQELKSPQRRVETR